VRAIRRLFTAHSRDFLRPSFVDQAGNGPHHAAFEQAGASVGVGRPAKAKLPRRGSAERRSPAARPGRLAPTRPAGRRPADDLVLLHLRERPGCVGRVANPQIEGFPGTVGCVDSETNSIGPFPPAFFDDCVDVVARDSRECRKPVRPKAIARLLQSRSRLGYRLGPWTPVPPVAAARQGRGAIFTASQNPGRFLRLFGQGHLQLARAGIGLGAHGCSGAWLGPVSYARPTGSRADAVRIMYLHVPRRHGWPPPVVPWAWRSVRCSRLVWRHPLADPRGPPKSAPVGGRPPPASASLTPAACGGKPMWGVVVGGWGLRALTSVPCALFLPCTSATSPLVRAFRQPPTRGCTAPVRSLAPRRRGQPADHQVFPWTGGTRCTQARPTITPGPARRRCTSACSGRCCSRRFGMKLRLRRDRGGAATRAAGHGAAQSPRSLLAGGPRRRSRRAGARGVDLVAMTHLTYIMAAYGIRRGGCRGFHGECVAADGPGRDAALPPSTRAARGSGPW